MRFDPPTPEQIVRDWKMYLSNEFNAKQIEYIAIAAKELVESKQEDNPLPPFEQYFPQE